MTTSPQGEHIRLCKKLDEWPEPDQALWRAAVLAGDLFEDGGTRAGYSHFSNREVVAGYGRWLRWLEEQQLCDSGLNPGQRIIPSRVTAYITDLEKVNATQTLLNRLQELQAAALVMAPHHDWSWINRIASVIRARHRPARPKWQRWVPSRVLFHLGLNLIERAENAETEGRRAIVHRAILHRDGLIIGLMAARQLRLRNVAGLVMDRTLVRNRSQWWIQIPASETKNGEVIERLWPEELLTPLETYLTCHRKILLGVGRDSQWIRGALWVSFLGSAMTMAGIYGMVIARTREGLGRAINPHLFRDCAVTSLAIEDPKHIGIATPLLGHRSVSTTERYYNQARSVEASRLIQQYLISVRNGGGYEGDINQKSSDAYRAPALKGVRRPERNPL
jgi:integrase/recombinase XerD